MSSRRRPPPQQQNTKPTLKKKSLKLQENMETSYWKNISHIGEYQTSNQDKDLDFKLKIHLASK